ncbi:hypothetical protein CONPUDRAFT_103265 [Coniophora puteana RWD-64-598 SS2]|uniref:Pentacotripeptide-repeat region of PRORP domain-containing protein n=1 Tax=Coniophora puteana (strain RWD-64-598) TaxID=741705 RepID=A0A5M3MSY5_CONPW|nr:uncharacterized protein CONPUDRAFT_103265 [Coniophora puteana RWD-64-598 SS2]EIW82279.1 hypothetical protein CONPUDRAFT_103265 [Coniophora puteana RWD-64-598 SS2]
MIEPLAFTIINSTLRRASPCSSALNRLMGPPPRKALPNDFFIPCARPWKGKEKEDDASSLDMWPKEGELSGSYPTQHPTWGCRRRMFTMGKPIPQRSRVTRHHSPHRMSRRNMTSYSSSATSSQLASSSSTPELADPYSRFQELIDSPELDFDLEEAWLVYKAAVASNYPSPKELLSFAERYIQAAEAQYPNIPDLDVFRRSGKRMEQLLAGIQSHITQSSSMEHWSCLMAQACALGDKMHDAVSLINDLNQNVKRWDLARIRPIIDAYLSVLLATRRYYGSAEILDVLANGWRFLGYYLVHTRNVRGTRFDFPDFRQRVLSILVDIEDPAAALHSRRNWPKDIQQGLGHVLTLAYCEADLDNDAFATYEALQRQDISLTLEAQLDLVRVFVRSDSFVRANALYDSIDIPPTDFWYDFYLSTGLYLYAHQGNVEQAEKAFAERQRPSSSDKAMLMQSYAVQGQAEKVVELFHRLFPEGTPAHDGPTAIHYTILMYAHVQARDHEGFNYWLKAMTRAGIPTDDYVYSVVIKSFALRGEVDSVATVLDQMRTSNVPPNPMHYSVAIAMLARRRDAVSAEALFKRALREGVVPDRVMVGALMNAHVEAGSWLGVIRAFDYLKSSSGPQLRLSTDIYNTLMKAYVMIGAPFKIVSELFRKLELMGVSLDGYSYTLLIVSACDSGKMDIALGILQEMDELKGRWRHNRYLDVLVLSIIMAAYLRVKDRTSAKSVFDLMQQRGIKPRSQTFSHIIRAYAEENTEEGMKLAEEFIGDILSDDPANSTWIRPGSHTAALEPIFRPLMTVYAKERRPEEVERLFQEMLNQGGEPSLATLTILMDAYRLVDDIDSVIAIWPQIWQLALRYSNVESLFRGDATNPSDPVKRHADILCIPLTIYMDALSKAGQHAIAAEAWHKARVHGFALDSHNWNHLVVVLIRAGEVERAFEVIERVVIPYQRKTREAPDDRETEPETPLIFDVNPVTVDSPAFDNKMRSTKRRAHRGGLHSRKLARHAIEFEKSNDFAHPLHILQHISPGWHTWRPHNAILQLLSAVIKHLESGYTVQAVEPFNEPSTATKDATKDDPSVQGLAAQAMLKRIHEQFPDTVRAILDFERRIYYKEASSRRSSSWI